jgi:tyrosine-protein phosphatase YwqE
MSLVSSITGIFGKKEHDAKDRGPFENPLKVELHSHLIPGVDDGSQSLQQSMELVKTFAAYGYRKIITTPHIMSDFYKNGPENIHPQVELIRNAIREEHIDIEFEAAAEYMVDDGLEKKVKNGEQLLTFGGNKKYILVELPFLSEPNNMRTVAFELNIAGYKPVLAHPERYPYYSMKKEKYEELYEQGFLFQLNQLSLIGYYSKQVQQAAEHLIDKGMVNLLGSDTHNIKHAVLQAEVFKSRLFAKACELELLNNYL